MIIIYKKKFKYVRKKSNRDLYLKSFENKNVKNSFLNFRISKFIKFNRDNNIKLSHIYKIMKINEKTNTKLNIKIFFIFIITKKIISNLIIRIKINSLFISLLFR